MTDQPEERDPCADCEALRCEPDRVPTCTRGTYYGEPGCQRRGRPADLAGAAARPEQPARRRRRGR